MSVWDTLGIDPTDNLLEIRSAFVARVDNNVDEQSQREELRDARDTAALWCIAGFPPSELGETDTKSLEEAFERVAQDRADEDPGGPNATDAARRFFDPAGFPEERRPGVLALRPHVETFATSLDRQAPTDEQCKWLADVIEASAEEDTELRHELKLILPVLLTRSAPAEETIDLAFERLLTGGIRSGSKDLHLAFIAGIIASRHSAETIESIASETTFSPRLMYDPDALASTVLVCGFRPTLFLYARCRHAAWERVQAKWNELSDLPPATLRTLLGVEAYEYWSMWVPKPPPTVVSVAQALCVPAMILGALVGVATVILIVGPKTPEAAWLWIPLAIPIVYGSAMACHLAWFALTWLAYRITLE
ncbi:MAG: hypothetical protein BMS9Abin37_1020 [Acidobacteriota bacterium]|nr:MAG: hypothetical protein BMS9Abin37_1020 [Acidobacteriota bacterium]